ncbi:hypothetical protein GGD57_002330 [Rhizobium esperanzae]|uniref:Uncharacterized protein n=1 Tax=Rhizobium esperanzae TaxID=1967781 RepID=A0A7W6R2Q2_9HYPH|nr:hypothetical protein [Rhizobium esperanzae]
MTVTRKMPIPDSVASLVLMREKMLAGILSSCLAATGVVISPADYEIGDRLHSTEISAAGNRDHLTVEGNTFAKRPEPTNKSIKI